MSREALAIRFAVSQRPDEQRMPVVQCADAVVDEEEAPGAWPADAGAEEETHTTPYGLINPAKVAMPPPEFLWLNEGERIEVEVEVHDGLVRWMPAEVLQVLVDGSFQATIHVPGDPFEDWFTWQDEGKDWRRPPLTRAEERLARRRAYLLFARDLKAPKRGCGK